TTTSVSSSTSLSPALSEEALLPGSAGDGSVATTSSATSSFLVSSSTTFDSAASTLSATGASPAAVSGVWTLVSAGGAGTGFFANGSSTSSDGSPGNGGPTSSEGSPCTAECSDSAAD